VQNPVATGAGRASPAAKSACAIPHNLAKHS
jgi:hypothetical protein